MWKKNRTLLVFVQDSASDFGGGEETGKRGRRRSGSNIFQTSFIQILSGPMWMFFPGLSLATNCSKFFILIFWGPICPVKCFFGPTLHSPSVPVPLNTRVLSCPTSKTQPSDVLRVFCFIEYLFQASVGKIVI